MGSLRGNQSWTQDDKTLSVRMGLFPPALTPAPKRWRLRVTHYDEITEVRGRTCLCSLFSTRLEVTGAEPQDRGLPSGPPWDWYEPVKRGSQAAPLTVTLRVRCQHCDSLVNTSFMILSVPPSDMSARTRPGVFPRAERRVLVGMCCGAGEEECSVLRAEPTDLLLDPASPQLSLDTGFISSGLTLPCHSLCFVLCAFWILHPLHTACETCKDGVHNTRS